MDTDGKVKYDALVRQGHDADRVVHSKFQDLVPKEILDEGDPSLNRPDQVKVFFITYSPNILRLYKKIFSRIKLTKILNVPVMR